MINFPFSFENGCRVTENYNIINEKHGLADTVVFSSFIFKTTFLFSSLFWIESEESKGQICQQCTIPKAVPAMGGLHVKHSHPTLWGKSKEIGRAVSW